MEKQIQKRRTITIWCILALQVVALFISFSFSGSASPKDNNLRVLYWNIQNGMWADQGNNYDSFVEWVQEQEPDICIWSEAQSIYKDGTDKALEPGNRYLVENWGILAARYGHKYWYVGGHRDNYPQVITSNHPIENIKRIIGVQPDSIVSHGAGWARINFKGYIINLVTVHLWPQAYAFNVKDRDASRAEHGGDKYRLMEMEYICKNTIKTLKNAEEELWLMAGDFNSRSSRDNWFYKYPPDDTRFLVHNYIMQNTPYVDIIAEKYPDGFKTTTYGKSRIDFIYCTSPLYNRIICTDVLSDEFTKPVRDEKKLSNFYHPSDHLPIIVEFDMQ